MMLKPFLRLQMPPTPTPFPTPNPTENPFSIIPHVALWDYAPKAVQTWNMAPPATTQLIQAVLVVLIIAAILFMAVNFLRSLPNEKDPSGDSP